MYDVVTQTCIYITLDLTCVHYLKKKVNTTAKMQICHMFGDLHMYHELFWQCKKNLDLPVGVEEMLMASTSR